MQRRRDPGRFRAAALLTALCLLLVGAGDAAPYEAQVWSGTAVSPGTHQAVALVDTYQGLCSGTLVRPRWVLTAAHCLDAAPGTRVTVSLGGVEAGGSFAEVFRTRLHVVDPSFAATGSDYALVRLPAPSNIPPVTLAGPDEVALYTAGTPALVVGWGAVDGKARAAGTLREGHTAIATDGRCMSLYGDRYDSVTMACGDASNADACAGDSGGPLFAVAEDALVQVGVTSFGHPCDTSFAGAYARVSNGRSWIDTTIAAGIPRAYATTTTAVAGPGFVAAGDPVAIRARLARAPDGANLADQRLELRRRRRGTSTWRTVGGALTNRDGRVLFFHRPRATTVYRVRHVGTPATTASRSESYRVRVAR